MISKVLIIRNGPYPVNINEYNDQFIGLARAFSKRNISSDIIFYSKSNYDIVLQDNPSIIIKNTAGIKILRTGIYLNLLKKDALKKYDLIITTEYSQIMTYLLGKKYNNIILYSGPYYNLFKIPILSKIYDVLFTESIDRTMNKILTKSNLATKYLSSKGYHNVKTIGVGQDISRFNEEQEVQNKTSEIIKYMKKRRTLLTVGSIDDRKNFPYTLRIFRTLLGQDDNYQLLVIGDGDRRYVNRHLNKLPSKIKNKIKFVGKIKNQQLQFIYPYAHAFLLPSKKEIFGMVLLEAMYFKAPVISSYNGGSTTMIKKNENGFICNINIEDISHWVSLIVKLNDTYLHDKIVNNAHNTIDQSFTWDALVDSFLQ